MRALLALALCVFACSVGSTPARFLVEAELEQDRIYVGGEVVLRLRLLRAPGLPYGVLRPPALGDAAELWSLRPARWYQAEREGAMWDVHERLYLLIPRRGGSLIVPGSEVEGPLRRQALPREMPALRGPQLTLEVRSIPAGAPGPWLPARQLTLEESWSPDPAALSAGTPITRTIILRADGLPAQRLPQVEMAQQPGLRVHHDQPELATEMRETGTVGRVIQRIVLVPLDDGELVLPVLGVRWWDVQADGPRIATLPARTLRLQPAFSPAVLLEAPAELSASTRALAVAVALLLVAWLWWRARREPLRDTRKQLRDACRANDARAARNALVQWWTVASAGVNPLLLQTIGMGWDDAARAQLGALDAALYGRRRWDGKEFWRRVRPWLRRPGSSRAAQPPSQSLFFRLQATNASAVRPD